MVHLFCSKIDPSPKKPTGKNQEVLAKGRNFLVEPGTSGLKFLVIPRSLKMDTLPEDENSPNQVPSWEAFFLVGSWLRPNGNDYCVLMEGYLHFKLFDFS